MPVRMRLIKQEYISWHAGYLFNTELTSLTMPQKKGSVEKVWRCQNLGSSNQIALFQS